MTCPVTEAERVGIVQEVRAGAHVTGPVDLALDRPSGKEESSPREPCRYGRLEAVVRIRARALAAIRLIHLRRGPKVGGLEIKNRQRRAIERVNDLVGRPGRERNRTVQGKDLVVIRAPIPVEV